MVEALGPDGPHESLRVGVRVRRPEWGPQDQGTFRLEDLVKAGRELCVAIADEEFEVETLVNEVAGHIPRLLVTQAALGWAVTPVIQARLRPSSMKNKT
jgi:hypothetical protein